MYFISEYEPGDCMDGLNVAVLLPLSIKVPALIVNEPLRGAGAVGIPVIVKGPLSLQ